MVFLQPCGFLENQQKFYFLKSHIQNLIKSLKNYGINKKSLQKDILKIIINEFI